VRTVLINIQQGLKARSQAVKHPRDTVNKQELEDAINSVQSIVTTCRENAENLQIIFEKVTSADDASWLKRYKAAIRTLKYGRQEKVESLMKEILDVRGSHDWLKRWKYSVCKRIVRIRQMKR
jgi:hypothetical protein